MTIQIEEGKFYKARCGERVGPMFKPADSPAEWPWEEKGGAAWRGGTRAAWRRDGSYSPAYVVHEYDLVAEWDEQRATHSIPEVMQELAVTEKADVKAEIADEAKRIVSGARRTAYGTPESNFERIARFWQAYLENTGRGDAKITAADVSPMMRLMKEARLCETPDHRDSFVDLVGYTLTGAEVNGVQPLTPDKPQA